MCQLKLRYFDILRHVQLRLSTLEVHAACKTAKLFVLCLSISIYSSSSFSSHFEAGILMILRTHFPHFISGTHYWVFALH